MGGSPEGKPGALTEQLFDPNRRENPQRLHLSPVKWAGWIRWLSFFPLLKRLQLTCYHSHFHNQQYRKSKEISILLDMRGWLAGKIRLENSLLSSSWGFSPANPKSPSASATWLDQRRCPLLLPMPPRHHDKAICQGPRSEAPTQHLQSQATPDPSLSLPSTGLHHPTAPLQPRSGRETPRLLHSL